ncbi:MAG TPA: HlyD family secretion protein [Gammaproteobacteria bacterium]|nr:HlyD family secretion protein [Gammaproteobacteria bacterium]
MSPRPRKRLVGRVLLVLGPLAVLAGGAYVYFTSGRFVDTENAYVQADKVVVSAEVSGTITRIAVQENQRVEPEQVLFAVDDRPYRAALERAEAQLQAVKAFLEGMRASYTEKVDQLALARTNAAYTKRELARQQGLAAKKLGTEADVDRAQHDYDVARQQIPIDEQAIAQLRAQLGGGPDVPLEKQASYVMMKSARDSAEIDLEHTIVRAPFEGIASKVPVLGQHVAPGVAVMSVVKNHDMWIEANYKETALTRVCPGQPVEIHIDTYPDHIWHGHVQSISEATGAEFSVIPAQNATGNWVKITQRIPVRISVPADEADPRLRAGMSATVTIDTGWQRPLPRFLRFGTAEAATETPPHCPPPAAEEHPGGHTLPTSLTSR